MFKDRFLLWGQKRIERGTAFLAPLSFIWGFCSWIRHKFYDRGWLSTYSISCPVISVGNLVAGGTGKTPLVQLLGEVFSSKQVAILSRGYGGDEPLLLQKRLPKARVYVGKNRALLAKRAQEEGADVIFLDDGFQYRKLHRDLDLVILKGEDPFGKGHFLPWGFLRDSPRRLQKADAVFVSGIPLPLETSIGIQTNVDRIVSLQGACISSLQDLPVALFCGIANPYAFKKTIEELGARVVIEWSLADHAQVKEEALQSFAKKAQHLGAQVIVCTEKDAVKLKMTQFALPIYVVEISMKVAYGVAEWEKLVAKIEQKIDTYKNEKRNRNCPSQAG